MLVARILVPPTARKGEILDIKALVTHPMETGYRRDHNGAAIPRNILTRFTCTYGGREVFAMTLFTGVAANPFVAFSTRATASGEMVFAWTDQHGATHTERKRIEVT